MTPTWQRDSREGGQLVKVHEGFSFSLVGLRGLPLSPLSEVAMDFPRWIGTAVKGLPGSELAPSLGCWGAVEGLTL